MDIQNGTASQQSGPSCGGGFSGGWESFLLQQFFVGNTLEWSYTKKKKSDPKMLGKAKNHRRSQVTISVKELVSADHFLRTIYTMIDFQFKEENKWKKRAVKPLAGLLSYCLQ
ncbi:hypothetical protein [Sinobaca sp. H24]|uniref:hypothetical protein n=1 Tax=Sinobaca sp. H24 TaxID=2923376 RepID=UPI00207A3CB4|nr:hypothetical protein [Sinobaca sp. H24]